MATPEQVELVARAVLEADYHFSGSPYEMMSFDDHHPHSRARMLNQATAAIAAYEATRPVVSDEELLAAYDAGCDKATAEYMREHNGVPDWPAPERNYHRTYDLAGVRAVRARLEGGQ